MIVQALVDSIELLLTFGLQRHGYRNEIALAAALLFDVNVRIKNSMNCDQLGNQLSEARFVAPERLYRERCRKLKQGFARHRLFKPEQDLVPRCLHEAARRDAFAAVYSRFGQLFVVDDRDNPAYRFAG